MEFLNVVFLRQLQVSLQCISLLCRGFRVKAYYIVGLRMVQRILTRTVSQTRDRTTQ